MEHQQASGCGAWCGLPRGSLAARHSQQLPGWSQYAEPALYQAGFRQTCLVAMWTSPATTTAISVIA